MRFLLANAIVLLVFYTNIMDCMLKTNVSNTHLLFPSVTTSNSNLLSKNTIPISSKKTGNRKGNRMVLAARSHESIKSVETNMESSLNFVNTIDASKVHLKSPNCEFDYLEQLKWIWKKLPGYDTSLEHNWLSSRFMYALINAIENEKKLAKMVITDHQHIMAIAITIWHVFRQQIQSLRADLIRRGMSGIDGIGKSDFFTQLERENMRFMGLVLWYLVFRPNPIFDQKSGIFKFPINSNPYIEPTDNNWATQLVQNLDKTVDARLEGQDWPQNLSWNNSFWDDYRKKYERQEELILKQNQLIDKGSKISDYMGRNNQSSDQIDDEESKIEDGQNDPIPDQTIDKESKTDMTDKGGQSDQISDQMIEKRSEIMSDIFSLINDIDAENIIWKPVPFYYMLCRPFIAFGRDAPEAILFTKALLEGKLNDDQLDAYLDGKMPLLDCFEKDLKYLEFATKLEKLGTFYRF